MEHIVKILSTKHVTHNVIRFQVEKPEGFTFTPGQATDLSINQEEWKTETRPFTFTGLSTEPYLEFTIKIYNDYDGVTHHLGKLNIGDELIIRDSWGAISYQGPGYFIAGGAGITPFIAILRQLKKDNKLEDNVLFFSNKTDKDIILEDELIDMLGNNAKFNITADESTSHDKRHIDADFLKSEVMDTSKHFYLCGPDEMVIAISKDIDKMGANADAVVFEK